MMHERRKEARLGQEPPGSSAALRPSWPRLWGLPEQSSAIRESTSDRDLDLVSFPANSLAGSGPEAVYPWHKCHRRSVGTTGGCLLTTFLAANCPEGRSDRYNPMTTKKDKLKRRN